VSLFLLDLPKDWFSVLGATEGERFLNKIAGGERYGGGYKVSRRQVVAGS
jgi:hypothetical protein